MFKHNKSLDKYKGEILNNVLKTVYEPIYDFVPKELTLEEKIEFLKKQDEIDKK